MKWFLSFLLVSQMSFAQDQTSDAENRFKEYNTLVSLMLSRAIEDAFEVFDVEKTSIQIDAAKSDLGVATPSFYIDSKVKVKKTDWQEKAASGQFTLFVAVGEEREVTHYNIDGVEPQDPLTFKGRSTLLGIKGFEVRTDDTFAQLAYLARTALMMPYFEDVDVNVNPSKYKLKMDLDQIPRKSLKELRDTLDSIRRVSVVLLREKFGLEPSVYEFLILDFLERLKIEYVADGDKLKLSLAPSKTFFSDSTLDYMSEKSVLAVRSFQGTIDSQAISFDLEIESIVNKELYERILKNTHEAKQAIEKIDLNGDIPDQYEIYAFTGVDYYLNFWLGIFGL